MKINRREFIVGAAALSTLPMPAIAAPLREPFVEVGDSVDFLYFEDWSRPFYPIGPLFVAAIGEWNGDAYPIALMKCGWREEDRLYCDGLDTEWSMLRKEISDVYMSRNGWMAGFPNIHSFVRNRRYGESPDVMHLAMAANHAGNPVAGRGEIVLRKTVWA